MKTRFSLTNLADPVTRIRTLLSFFIAALVVSGLTALPLQIEVTWLAQTVRLLPVFPVLQFWIERVQDGLIDTYQTYPFMAYGTDWLAFAHIVIAIAFIGPLRDPVRNIWVVEFGLIACLLIIPTALIAGAIREIPFFWQLVDCSFGVFGFIPLWLCRREILNLTTAGCAQSRGDGGLALPRTKAI